MKNKIFTTLLIVCLVAPSFFVITTIAGSKPNLLNTNDLYDISVEPKLESELIGHVDTEDYGDWTCYSPWWYDLVDKEDVTNDGEGVYVAVLDTGLLDNWPFFFPEGNIAWDLGKGFSHDIYWDDEYGLVMSELRDDRGFITDLASGHGTHVTSTIIGYNLNNLYYVEGIASKATIIPVLVLDAWLVDTPGGQIQLKGGTDEMVSAGIYYIADLADELDGPVIINMSLGGSEPTQMIEDAIDYAIAKGVIVVVSAGNEGSAGMDYPGAYKQVISTAMCGWTEMFYHVLWLGEGFLCDVPEELNVPDYFGNEYQVYLDDMSGRPNKTLGQRYNDLDVMLPGAWIVGPYKLAFSSAINYYYVSGTSMSAPHASAIAALILQTFPMFDQKDIESIFKIAASGKKFNELRGFPRTGEDVVVAYAPGYIYYANWGKHDFGKGFLKADSAMITAVIYFIFKSIFGRW